MLAQAHSGISPSGGGLGCQNREPTAALSCDRGEFGPDRIRDGGTVGGNFCAGFRIVQRDVEVGHGGSVDIGRLWMQARDRRRYLRKQLLQ